MVWSSLVFLEKEEIRTTVVEIVVVDKAKLKRQDDVYNVDFVESLFTCVSIRDILNSILYHDIVRLVSNFRVEEWNFSLQVLR